MMKRLFSFELLVFVASLVFVYLDESRGTLFGREAAESFASTWSFAPARSFVDNGLRSFTYPVVHVGWTHVVGSGLVWVFLGRRLRIRFRKLSYGLGSVAIAASFALPFAPLAVSSDRILGLSCLVFFQLGAILASRAGRLDWALALALVALHFVGSPTSPLSTWGHAAGAVVGVVIGLSLRASISGGSGASASRRANRR